MKLMKTEDAVGQVLCHDITQIIRGVTKDAVFRKGHVIRPEDVPVLLSVGKDTVYIWENDETMLHENDAAYILRDICMNANMTATEPKEGKIELIADTDGLFLVDLERLRAVNALGDMMIATRASGFMVKKGDKLCGTRVIPLVIKKERMEAAKQVAGGEPIMQLVPVKPKKYGLVTTGNEVFYGRIEDTFTPVIQAKMAEFGCEMQEHVVPRTTRPPLPSRTRARTSSPTAHRCCRGPCSCWPIRTTAARSAVCLAASCMPNGRFLTWCCRIWSPIRRSRRNIWRAWATAASASTARSATSRTAASERAYKEATSEPNSLPGHMPIIRRVGHSQHTGTMKYP